MGRALYSQTYGIKAPAVHVEPEATPCPEKWSIYNRFDPDSDEFFADAEYEAFMDQEHDGVGVHVAVASDSASDDTSDDSDSVGGRDSPPVRMTAIWDRMLDDEAVAAATYQAVPEDQLLLDIPGYTRADDFVPIRVFDDHPRAVSVSVSVSTSPPLHPPSALRNSTTATDLALARAPSPSDSLSEPASPRTPPPVHAHLQLLTPSPAPTVTPRIYMWGAGGPTRTHAPASPGSPSVRHTHSAGPLTNPSARQSLARLPTRRVSRTSDARPMLV
ncbi:hypothetical protein DFH09DRAFT_1376125 [Mycena vulgaris]|nr:hypothetical protein DFH09DRAFT_1376125 [Mycena vulgaris]